MEVVKAIRARLEPKAKALGLIRRFAGCRRHVYNRLLAEREAAWRALGAAPSPEARKAFSREWSYEGMAHRITIWREEVDWLAACPVHALQNAARDLQGAYERWWKGLGDRPRLKRKSSGRDTWRESDPACFDVNGQAVKLPKIGWVRARITQAVAGSPRSLTVRQDGEHWFASVVVKEEVADPAPNAGPALGIDLGVVHEITDSDGVHYDLPTATEEEKAWLKRMARAVSRKKKGSQSRAKAQRRLNRARAKIARRVLDETHKTTTPMARGHGAVVHEDIKIANMTASAAGTAGAPGKNVRAKAGLNREILARSWGEIRRQFGYKCQWYGSVAVAAPPAYSSQECAECGHVHPGSRETQAAFQCVACGYAANADHNAARVILKRGLKMLAAGQAATACGDGIRPPSGRLSTKQEPARGRRQRAVA